MSSCYSNPVQRVIILYWHANNVKHKYLDQHGKIETPLENVEVTILSSPTVIEISTCNYKFSSVPALEISRVCECRNEGQQSSLSEQTLWVPDGGKTSPRSQDENPSYCYVLRACGRVDRIFQRRVTSISSSDKVSRGERSGLVQRMILLQQ